MGTRIGDLAVVFISFDEPQADEHWERLLLDVPNAVRVNGVKGINSAFRAAAEAATTERFLTVDGDCRIDPAFADHFVDDDKINSRRVISWPARNVVNGLTYGNGGPKCWTRSMLRAKADPDSAHFDHVSMFGFLDEPRVMATVHPNGSAYQAFRSGYREGVRLSMRGREPIGLQRLSQQLPPNTRKRLATWCMLGADMPFGLWCIFGARRGCLDAQGEDFDPALLADYAHFRAFFEQLTQGWGLESQSPEMLEANGEAGDIIREAGLDIAELAPDASRFFKEMDESSIELSRFDMLGQAFLADDDIPARPEKAFTNFFAGALMNSSNAMNNLARCYRDGIGTERNPAKAKNWVLSAAALNNEFALLRLGRNYLEGRGVGQDHGRACYWLGRAARAGSEEAREILATNFDNMDHTPPSFFDPDDVDAIIGAFQDESDSNA